jgi:hypothetical protein
MNLSNASFDNKRTPLNRTRGLNAYLNLTEVVDKSLISRADRRTFHRNVFPTEHVSLKAEFIKRVRTAPAAGTVMQNGGSLGFCSMVIGREGVSSPYPECNHRHCVELPGELVIRNLFA